MSIIARDPDFSWSSPLDDDVASEKTNFTSNSGSYAGHTKPIERRLVNAWKTLTRSTRKQKRVSVYAKDFVFVTATPSQRRDNMMLQQSRRSQQAAQPTSRAHGHRHL